MLLTVERSSLLSLLSMILVITSSEHTDRGVERGENLVFIGHMLRLFVHYVQLIHASVYVAEPGQRV